MSRPIRRVLFRDAVASDAATVIHLRQPLPTASSALPVVLGRAALERTLSELAPGGVYQADPVTGAAGGLLHHRFTLAAAPAGRSRRFAVAVCSLWHCPAGHPGWPLATTAPCGARTFLGGDFSPTRPPGRLIRLQG